jgi:peptidyl-prolyl cis-trans isomerase B (cyclophilin B)
VPDAILPFLEHDDPVIRAYAARTLGKQKATNAVEKLIELLGDANDKVLINTMNALATILEGKQEKKVVEPLGLIMEKHPSHHVRTAAVMTVGSVGDKSAKDYLAQSILDSDRVIRAESFKSLAKALGEQSVVFLSSGLKDSEFIVRLATIEAYGLAGDKKQLDFLLATASDDPDRLVRAAAVRALGHFKYDDVSAVLLQKLNDEDWVVAAESVTALGEIGDKKAIQSLIDRYEMRNDREDKDVRLQILSVLTEMKAEEAESVARGALDDGDKRIRTAGKKLLERLKVEIPEVPGDRYFYERDRDISRKVALSLPMGEKRAIIRCEYGTVEIKLYGDDATQTVANFVKLARKGFYSNNTFHRVVPNFVVQGGCPRGDGWGDDGYYIRSEFNRFHYSRGAVGIAHSGKDTGGTQFFINHSPQPHLDGRYTIFGRVTKGMDVVDKIRQGDKFQVEIMD